ncbi:MAG: Dot/Icm T4SS effector Zinc-dependent metalloprotease LegP [Cyanobacteria bacterium P01_H01_bin.21]
MSCTIGQSYIVKSGDIPFDIAQRELGNGNRWREILKPDGSRLTELDAINLQPGQQLCIPGAPLPSPSILTGFANIVSRQIYETMFPHRNDLYDYDSLIAAVQQYPQFCNEGTPDQRRQEAAAFLANIAHETTGGWETAPGGRHAWGLHFIEEVGCENGSCTGYCDVNNSIYPCASGQTYHGRGPMQLSWNYNYGAAGQALGVDLLANPDLVKSDGTLAFQTALWFWMTPQPPKPSCHDVMAGRWAPSAEDVTAGRTPGFGMTINIINGGLECSIPTNGKVQDRVGFYQRFTQLLGVTMGEAVYCDRMRHYALATSENPSNVDNGNCGCGIPFDGFLASDDIRTGFISGENFTNKAVQYAAVDGLAVFEGCIVLGTVEEMEQHAAKVQTGEISEDDIRLSGVHVSNPKKLWPNGIVPYAIASDLPNKERIRDAIAHWEERTSIRFVRRSNSNASQYPNYIYFQSADGCWSYVGMQGGRQEIGLASGCSTGTTIHEIGHALGLWHEQSREDRDRHIKIHWDNIKSDHAHNFSQHINDGDDHGPYDYASIMHYHATAFAKDRNKPTITPIISSKHIGQRQGLSAGDIATIRTLYPEKDSGKGLKKCPPSRPYTVQQGDWLHNIAERELGSGDRWREILKTPNNDVFTEAEVEDLNPGQIIYLPVN